MSQGQRKEDAMNATTERAWVPHDPDRWPFHFATLLEPVEMRTWHGHGASPEFTYRTVPAGTKIKIVMASRFSDVGITDDLTAVNGYAARVDVAILQECATP